MCGVVGVVNLYEPRPVAVAILRQMLGMIRHRGPDQFGIYQDEWANLGNARLSIVDLGGGQQPISNEDETLWIVFNGEIFNYQELRPDLEKRGHRFKTDCDTEVILHLYEEYGYDCLNYLNGQFAIALWDSRQRRLLMARDRLGIRPLFYTVCAGQLIFGSEIKTLLAHPAVKAEIDPIALAQLFTFWAVPGPNSIFKQILTLPAGHYLIAQAGNLTIEPYWELDFTPTAATSQAYFDQFQQLLIDATLIRLRADVPVGAYLSGGLDSSTTTAIIQRYSQNCLKTFSIAFSDPEFDESIFQRQMADQLGTEHQVLHCTPEQIGAVFPAVIWHTETPLLRTAPVPMFLLSRLVHQHDLKVVITGEGADEFLAGYDIFKETMIRHFWAKQPDSTLRPLLLKRLYPEIGRLGQHAAFLTSFFKKQLTETETPFYSHLIRWSNGGRLQRLLQAPALSPPTAMAALPLPDRFQQWSPLAKAQYLEITTFMTPYLLCSQGDRVAMAHSVEGRFPFLDHRVVEFCNRLPSALKLRGLNEKQLLRQFARQLLPAEIWQRRKRPYRAPIHRSFFSAHPPDYVLELLSPQALQASGLFNPAAVAQLLRKAQSGLPLSEVDEMGLVGVLSTQLVDQQFVKAFDPRSPLTETDSVKIVHAQVKEELAV